MARFQASVVLLDFQARPWHVLCMCCEQEALRVPPRRAFRRDLHTVHMASDGHGAVHGHLGVSGELVVAVVDAVGVPGGRGDRPGC